MQWHEKLLRLVFQRVHCDHCGGYSPASSKFCGKCGCRFVDDRSSLPLKQILAVASAGFFVTFLLTIMVLRSSSPLHADEKLFDDIPVDHQAYSECRNLMAFDGIRLRARQQFSPYEDINADEFNQAFLSAMRFNRCSIQDQLLVKGAVITGEIFKDRVCRLAEITGKTGLIREIEETQYSDLTRFNVFRTIEAIFMRAKVEK
ncbi:MAG: hypothetical protein ACOYXC_06985 [Candidatus Rifleibacteriota bacterium]